MRELMSLIIYLGKGSKTIILNEGLDSSVDETNK